MEQPDLNAPLPAVAPADVQALWQFMEMSSTRPGDTSSAGASGGANSSTVGFDRDLLAGQCSPGADVMAVFLRTVLLRTALDSGLPAAGQRDPALSAVVFEVAATFPIPRLASFDMSGFVARLRNAGGPE